MNGLSNVMRAPEKCEQAAQMIPQTILDNLKQRKLHIEDQLSRVNAAINALESNPEVAKVLELVAKTNY